MCDVVIDIELNGRHYFVPFYPQYEVQRLRDIQAHLLPLIDYLKEQFEPKDRIFMTWDDDTEIAEDRFTWISQDNRLVPYVTDKVNEYANAHGWRIELPRSM